MKNRPGFTPDDAWDHLAFSPQATSLPPVLHFSGAQRALPLSAPQSEPQPASERSGNRILRRSHASSGFTLIELIIYFAMSVMALGIIYSLFTVARRTQTQTYSHYLVGGSLSSAVRQLRRELQATALSSIKVFPEGGAGSPGLSCVSAYDDGQFTINGYGVPDWKKHVFYTLDSKGSLARWSKVTNPAPNFLPTVSTIDPAAVESDGGPVMAGLLPPNTAAKNFYPGSPFGGFEVSFIRRDKAGKETLTQVNPSKSKEYDTHTRLVQVTLRTFEDKSEPDFSELTFRVCPRY